MGGFVREYWEQRFAEGVTLGSVGWWGFGEAFNGWMYAVRRAVFLRLVRPFVSPDMNVLDVGSGTGFYVRRWRELGVRDVTASDMTTAAVAALGSLGSPVFQLDIGESGAVLDRRFAAISAMDVLFHIVDDDRYRTSFHNIAAMLRPGGLFVFSENMLHRAALAGPHQVSRTMAETVEALHDAELTIVLRRPMFVFANTPVDSASPMLRRSWQLLRHAVRHDPTRGYAVGAALFVPELLATRIVREGPSTELVICRRR
jgi:2-polyprenyl-3-methyl-5-hydroxy-6-metoxy-1,4-benzoquinol methylase